MDFKRRIGMVLLALLVVAALIYGFLPEPVAVDAAPVVRDTLRVSVTEEGMTRVKDRFVVSAPVAGYLRRIKLRVADRVEQGMILAELEPVRSEVLDPRSRAQAQARVAAAEASHNAARENARAAISAADYAKSEYQRLRRLCEIKCVITKDELERSRTEAERSQANRRSAEFAVEVAHFELEAARTALEHSAAQSNQVDPETVKVRSPVNGRVLGLKRESEGVVAAGQPLLEIGDPGTLEVVVELLSTDAVKVESGTRVLFDRWGGDSTLEGRVRVVEPTGFTKISALGVEEQRVRVVVDLTSPPAVWQRLGDGYRVEAEFILWEGNRILQIPASALFRYAGDWTVFVIANGHAQRRKVELGRRNGLRAQILSGLNEGEQVILHPDESIEPGTRVQLRE